MRTRTPRTLLRRAVAAGAVIACALAVAAPAAGAARRLRLHALAPGAAQSVRLFRMRVPDRLRASAFRAHAALRARAAASEAMFRTSDGVPIPVAVSSAYRPDPAVEQGYVDFLGGLVHGPELAKLSVYIATPSQIQNTFCGAGALACYISDEQRMYVPGTDQHSDPPVQFLIEHEYGHHIELNRSNAPWSAFDWGAKRWASYKNVCALKRRHRIANGYYSDPSEAFAESYADMQYPGVDFIYTNILAPDQGAFDAIRADVLDPWSGPHTETLTGSFGNGRARSRTFRLHTPLDGSASFDLTEPAGAHYRLELLAGSRMVRHARRARRARLGHAATAASYLICGTRTVTVRVTRASGRGPFEVRATIP